MHSGESHNAGPRMEGGRSSELAAEMGAQGLTLMLGTARGCKCRGLGWESGLCLAAPGTHGGSRRSGEISTAELKPLRSKFTRGPFLPAFPRPGRQGLGSGGRWGGGHSSLLLCLLFITVSCLKPSLSNHLPSRAELPEDKMNVCRPQSCDALEEVEGEEEGINTRHINKSWGEVRG